MQNEILLSEVVKRRRSTPAFSPEPITPEHLNAIIEAAINAPSGFNLQPWRFIFVTSPEGRRAVMEASFYQTKIAQAPVVVVAAGDPQAWREDIDRMLKIGEERGFDTAHSAAARDRITGAMESLANAEAWINRQVMIALTQMMLAAEAFGYDTAMLEGFSEREIKELLDIPEHMHVVCLLLIGKGAGADKPDGGRFPQEQTVFHEKFGAPLRVDTE